MNKISRIKIAIDELIDSSGLIEYSICREIISYLEENPNQKQLTITGIRTALSKSAAQDKLIINAAFTLSAHPFFALEVKYRLYDPELEEVIETIDQNKFLVAIKEGFYIDNDGNKITIDDLNKRLFPFFTNLLPNLKIGDNK